jgi:molecular chaperone DnaK (HSP70)
MKKKIKELKKRIKEARLEARAAPSLAGSREACAKIVALLAELKAAEMNAVILIGDEIVGG